MTRKLLLLVVSMVVGVLLVEAAARLLFDNPYRDEDLDHILRIRRPHAGSVLRIARHQIDEQDPFVDFRTDARGYIRPSRRFEDPDATVVFLGGSTTECSAVREDTRFPALVSTLLEERGLQVDTLNGARSGNTVHDSLNVLLNHVVIDEPDAVVLMHATNDIGVLRNQGDYRSRMGGEVGVGDLGRWLVQYTSSRSQIVAMLRRATSSEAGSNAGATRKPRSLGDDPERKVEQFEGRLRAFARSARALGIEPVLMTQPLAVEGFNELTPDWANAAAQVRFNAVIREVAATESVALIDLARRIPDEFPDWDAPMNLFYDGMHVTDAGSRVYAKIIAEALVPLLGELDPARRPGK